MVGAGSLRRRRVRFEQRAEDANGDRLGDWAEVVTRNAQIVPLKGGETVKGQRLEGAQPVVIAVRKDGVTATIDNTMRAVDARDAATTWKITSAIWNEDEGTMEFLAVERRNGFDG